MLEAYAESRPETASRNDLPVGSSRVVIGTDRGARRHVALAQHKRGAQEGIVVVLFVCREYQRVQYLAAGYRRIIGEIRVDEPGAVFQLRITAHDKPHRLYAIENPAPRSDDAVHQFASFADLRLGVR